MNHQQYLADQQGQSKHRTELVVIILSGILAVLVPLYAIGQIYMFDRQVTVIAQAEDDCEYFIGELPLIEVEPTKNGTVMCTYGRR